MILKDSPFILGSNLTFRSTMNHTFHTNFSCWLSSQTLFLNIFEQSPPTQCSCSVGFTHWVASTGKRLHGPANIWRLEFMAWVARPSQADPLDLLQPKGQHSTDVFNEFRMSDCNMVTIWLNVIYANTNCKYIYGIVDKWISWCEIHIKSCHCASKARTPAV